MKTFLALAIGLGLILGTVSFAQDSSTMTKKAKKKKKTDSTDTAAKKM